MSFSQDLGRNPFGAPYPSLEEHQNHHKVVQLACLPSKFRKVFESSPARSRQKSYAPKLRIPSPFRWNFSGETQHETSIAFLFQGYILNLNVYCCILFQRHPASIHFSSSVQSFRHSLPSSWMLLHMWMCASPSNIQSGTLVSFSRNVVSVFPRIPSEIDFSEILQTNPLEVFPHDPPSTGSIGQKENQSSSC